MRVIKTPQLYKGGGVVHGPPKQVHCPEWHQCKGGADAERVPVRHSHPERFDVERDWCAPAENAETTRDLRLAE
jgi:hypothetical protein